MKTITFGVITGFVSVALLLQSCENNLVVGLDDNKKNTPTIIEDDNAGSFQVFNQSSGEKVPLGTIISNYAYIWSEDTLKIVFVPKNTYSAYRFSVQCTDLLPVNDSLFIVPKDMATQLNEHKIGQVTLNLSASYEEEGSDSIVRLSANKSYQTMYRPGSLVSYSLYLSEDLLRFVSPVLTFRDSRNNERILNPTLSDFDMMTITIRDYIDANGKHHTVINEGKVEEDWTLVNESSSVYPTYYFTPDNTYRESTQSVIVNYMPVAGAEVLDGVDYSFERSLSWKAPGYFNIDLTISFGEESTSKNMYEDYLAQLSQTNDTLTLQIDKAGHVLR